MAHGMELRAFAERVLLSDSLEEKLAPPAERLTDECPGPALLKLEAPGRPDGLRMAGRGDRVELPPERDLHREEERAVLLHLFANHELLATELMALAILRFAGPCSKHSGTSRSTPGSTWSAWPAVG